MLARLAAAEETHANVSVAIRPLHLPLPLATLALVAAVAAASLQGVKGFLINDVLKFCIWTSLEFACAPGS